MSAHLERLSACGALPQQCAARQRSRSDGCPVPAPGRGSRVRAAPHRRWQRRCCWGCPAAGERPGIAACSPPCSARPCCGCRPPSASRSALSQPPPCHASGTWSLQFPSQDTSMPVSACSSQKDADTVVRTNNPGRQAYLGPNPRAKRISVAPGRRLTMLSLLWCQVLVGWWSKDHE